MLKKETRTIKVLISGEKHDYDDYNDDDYCDNDVTHNFLSDVSHLNFFGRETKFGNAVTFMSF